MYIQQVCRRHLVGVTVTLGVVQQREVQSPASVEEQPHASIHSGFSPDREQQFEGLPLSSVYFSTDITFFGDRFL